MKLSPDLPSSASRAAPTPTSRSAVAARNQARLRRKGRRHLLAALGDAGIEAVDSQSPEPDSRWTSARTEPPRVALPRAR